MAQYTQLNLRSDVEDMAPRFGMGDEMEARFGRKALELEALDAIRVPGAVTRGMEGGPDGAEVVAFGAPNTDNKDTEMVSDFWQD